MFEKKSALYPFLARLFTVMVMILFVCTLGSTSAHAAARTACVELGDNDVQYLVNQAESAGNLPQQLAEGDVENALQGASLCSSNASYQPANVLGWSFFLGHGSEESSSVAMARKRMQFYSSSCNEIGHVTVSTSTNIPFLTTLLWANNC